MFAVNDFELTHIFNAFHPLLFIVGDVVVGKTKRLQYSLMASLVCGIFFLEAIEDVAHSQTVARNLVGVCRSDAFSCCAYLALSFGRLIGTVKNAVGGHYKMCLFRYVKPAFQVVSAFLQFLGFGHEQVGGKHHTVAYDIHLASLEYSGRYAAENIFFSFKLQSVPGIRSTLKTCHYIIIRCKHVNDFSFSFIAPLQSEQDIDFTCTHILFL